MENAEPVIFVPPSWQNSGDEIADEAMVRSQTWATEVVNPATRGDQAEARRLMRGSVEAMIRSLLGNKERVFLATNVGLMPPEFNAIMMTDAEEMSSVKWTYSQTPGLGSMASFELSSGNVGAIARGVLMHGGPWLVTGWDRTGEGHDLNGEMARVAASVERGITPMAITKLLRESPGCALAISIGSDYDYVKMYRRIISSGSPCPARNGLGTASRPRRFLGIAKWIGMSVSLLLIVLWIGGSFCYVGWRGHYQLTRPDGDLVKEWGGLGSGFVQRFGEVGNGAIAFGYFPIPPERSSIYPDGWRVAFGRSSLQWGFGGTTFRWPWMLDIPLWILAAPALLVTGAVWRLDAIARRRAQAGHCPSCGYDLGGVAKGAACPECGSVN